MKVANLRVCVLTSSLSVRPCIRPCVRPSVHLSMRPSVRTGRQAGRCVGVNDVHAHVCLCVCVRTFARTCPSVWACGQASVYSFMMCKAQARAHASAGAKER